jgi:arylsulfatase A-like enzyme/tetratricopeptide (TPR) repeat protein
MHGARLAAALLAGVVALGCQRDLRPDVVLLTLDTTRGDALGVMGREQARTPRLDALGAEGVVFERGYSSTSLTLPSHTTILSGLEPLVHGVHDNGVPVPAQGFETLAERLAKRGYDTGAFVSAFILDSRFGLDRGFAHYDDEITWRPDPLSFLVPQRRGGVTTDRALAWLEDRGRKPFFLWVHYYDPHAPRDPPPPFDEIEGVYDAEVAYMDAQIGRLLDGVRAAGRGRPTLVIAVADHGESLGEHGEDTHGTLAYDSTLHVPLLVSGPGFPAATRSTSFARTADVFPTVLAAVGEPSDGAGAGVPLQRLVAGEPAEERIGYFESLGPATRLGWARLVGVRTQRWKYTGEPDPVELYDVIEDPGETRNRAAEQPEVVARLRPLHEARRPEGALPSASALSPELQQQLAALGYLSAPQQFAPGEAPDPRVFVRALGLVEDTRSLAREGRVGDAIRLLEILARKPPVRALALESLIPAYVAAGRGADAVLAAQALAAVSESSSTPLLLAQAHLAAGDPSAALAVLDEAAGLARSSQRQLLRANALLRLERPQEALDAASPVVAENPHDDRGQSLAAQARISLGTDRNEEIARLEAVVAGRGLAGLEETRTLLADLLASAGRIDDARRLLEDGAESSPELQAGLGGLALQRKDPDAAIGHFEAAFRLRPAELSLRRRLVDLYVERGKVEPALVHYDAMVTASPADPELRMSRGIARLKAGQLAPAREDFEETLRLDPSVAEAELNLALVAMREERPDRAEEHLRRAVELRPDYAKAHFHLARLYRKRGDPRAAHHAEQAAAGLGAVGMGPGPVPRPAHPEGGR